MGENKCFVFVNGSIIVVESNGKIMLPMELMGYPIIITNNNGTKVIISQPINNAGSRALMRSYILQTIELYRSQEAVPRLEFSRWNEMLIFPVALEGADEEYWCPEQVVDSFLDLYGPEFVL